MDIEMWREQAVRLKGKFSKSGFNFQVKGYKMLNDDVNGNN
jgi:hypothetical protein